MGKVYKSISGYVYKLVIVGVATPTTLGNKGQGNRGISSLQFRYSEWETVNLINLHYNFSLRIYLKISPSPYGERVGVRGYYNTNIVIANECEAIQPIFNVGVATLTYIINRTY